MNDLTPFRSQTERMPRSRKSAVYLYQNCATPRPTTSEPRIPSFSSSSACAPTWAACPSPTPDLSAATIARATGLTTTARAGSGRGPRR